MSLADALPAHAARWRPGWGATVLAVALALTVYRMAVVQHAGITLFVDEAYYWTGSREPAWGYFTKPPVIAWLIGAGTALWGDSVLGVKALTMLLYPASAWALYRLGSEVFNERTGALAALLFICSPMAGLLGLAASTDAPLLLCWTLAAWALWRALNAGPAGAWAAWAGVGLCFGVGMLSKYSMAAFVLSALPLLWWRRTAPGVMGGALLAAALAAVCLSPHLAWNAIYGAPTLLHTAEITVGGSSPGGWPALAEFLASQTLMLGPLATLLLLRPGWVAKLPNDPRLRFALALTLPLLALASVQAWQTRANMNWAAPAFIGASLLVAHLLAELRPRWTLALLASNLLLVAAVVHARDMAQWVKRPLPERADFFVRMRGWDSAFAALTPALAAHPGWPLLAEGRALRAHAAYAWRAQGLRLAMAPHAGPPRDQFELWAAAEPTVLANDVLVLVPGTARPVLACNRLEQAGSAQVALGPTRQLTLTLWACSGWQPSGTAP